jgi:glycosyltransferase involved in cell wall biosynthesis
VPSVDPSKPSVAFLIDEWDPSRGGAERAMASFAEHLERRGHRVLAVAERHAGGAPGEPVPISSSGLTRSRRERDRARKLVAAARARGAAVTVGCRHLFECDLYWPHGGAHAATLRQIRLSEGERADAAPHGRHRTFLDLERVLLERGGARRVACVSRLVLDELAREWPACRERLVLVENGVDLCRFEPEGHGELGASFRRELGLDREGALLLFVARNPRLKGLRELAAALRILLERCARGWTLLAICPDPPERAAPDAIQLRASGRMAWRRQADPLASYLAADLCVAPTWRDTSGLVILESLACGTPVVTTSFAGASGLVDGEAGSVVRSPGDVRALADEIGRWVERVAGGSIDRAAIRRRVEHLDLGRCHETLEKLVLELAGERASRTG